MLEYKILRYILWSLTEKEMGFGSFSELEDRTCSMACSHLPKLSPCCKQRSVPHAAGRNKPWTTKSPKLPANHLEQHKLIKAKIISGNMLAIK